MVGAQQTAGLPAGRVIRGDGSIGLASWKKRLNQAHQPLRYIYKVEGHIEQFAHLARVNPFVVQVHGRKRSTLADKDDAEEVDGQKWAEGEKTIVDEQDKGAILRVCEFCEFAIFEISRFRFLDISTFRHFEISISRHSIFRFLSHCFYPIMNYELCIMNCAL